MVTTQTNAVFSIFDVKSNEDMSSRLCVCVLLFVLYTNIFIFPKHATLWRYENIGSTKFGVGLSIFMTNSRWEVFRKPI